MGWSDSKIHLTARGWRMTSKEKLVPVGQVVRILDVVRDQDSQSTKLNPQSIHAWLDERGFERVQPASEYLTFRKNDIAVEPYALDGELASVILTFELSKESPARWLAWRQLLDEFCKTWKLSPIDPRNCQRVDPSECMRLLSETTAWKEFAAHIGWPSLTSVPTPAGSSDRGLPARH
ncbi:MAG: hypothetical protein L0Y72_04065 [Gemmataceae bacterium]|nr:hypothetical protein [Gemmataceae bacterium]MCI0738195.1 hypothetical protein [Gemmataceae bacterium]